MARATEPRYEWPLATAAGICAIGLVLTLFDGWRAGLVLLRVRRRTFDVVMLLAIGTVVLALALAVPALPR
jgi:hypothetical protein